MNEDGDDCDKTFGRKPYLKILRDDQAARRFFEGLPDNVDYSSDRMQPWVLVARGER
jgi:hypothetical protein